MESSSQYLSRMHAIVADNYDNYVGENGGKTRCWDIADEIFDILKREKKSPYKIRFSQYESLYNEDEFVPLPYTEIIEKNKMVGWKFHWVCCADDLAYDPIFGETVPLEEYSIRLFGKKWPYRILTDRKDPFSLEQKLYDLYMAA